MNKKYKIIDFHTHPFDIPTRNICAHKEYANMSIENTKRDFLALGVEKICGSVIEFPYLKKVESFDDVKKLNDTALELAKIYDGFYVPGFHVHPSFVDESIKEIERMARNGVNLIGELVPYIHRWGCYYNDGLAKILDVAEHYNMVVSFHGPGNEDEEKQTDRMIQSHKNIKFVAAHPGEKDSFLRHLARMRISENYYLDLSGTGLFRHGLLRHGINEFGAERFLYGSDYPTCNPAMFIGGVADDFLITEEEKKKILFKNAAKLLRLE